MYGLRPGLDFGLEQMIQIRQKLGLDRPIYIQYFIWLGKLVRGDLGRSISWRTPVNVIVRRALTNTLKMQIPSLLLAIAISIPTGVISAVKQYSKVDYVAMSLSLLTWSLPWFWYSLMAIYLFSIKLGWFPAGGMFTLGSKATILDQLYHMILPVFVLGTMSTGFITRLVRSSMLEVLRQDYIVVARSKGLAEKVVIYKHALKNALLPTVTVIGLYVGFLVGGAAITETVFTWPGTGQIMVEASKLQDYPVIMGITIIVSTSVLFSVLFTDILYAYLDPRIRYG
jgi:peptide/nickel transport system permease protein